MRKLLRAGVTLLLATTAIVFTGGTAQAAVAPCDVGSGLCTSTVANVWLRATPQIINSPGTGNKIILMGTGARFYIECWVWGPSVNGDQIWYKGQHRASIDVSPISWERGYAAGYYLATGRDPHPSFNNCVDS